MKYNQKNLYTDAQGYLTKPEEWNEKMAIYIAKTEGLTLNSIHWEIIYFVRMYYKEFQSFPRIRLLINSVTLKYGKKKGNSRYLARLFPNGPAAQQISKISGLPKPPQCL